MNKRLLVVLIFFFVPFFCFANDVENEDISFATYKGKESEMNMDSFLNDIRNEFKSLCGDNVYKIEKLTKYEERLLCNALNKYRFESGDVYTITMIEKNSDLLNKFFYILVIIDKVYADGGFDYSWSSIGMYYFEE